MIYQRRLFPFLSNTYSLLKRRILPLLCLMALSSTSETRMATPFTASLASDIALRSALSLHCSHQKYLLQDDKFNQHQQPLDTLYACFDLLLYLATWIDRGLAQGNSLLENLLQDNNNGMNRFGEDQNLHPVYASIQRFLSQNTDTVLILAMNPFPTLLGKQGSRNDQEIREFTQFLSSTRSFSKRSRFILIYNTNQSHNKDKRNPLRRDSPTTTLYHSGADYRAVPTPDVMIFSSGHAT